VAALHEIFPEAPIFTTIVDPDELLPALSAADIRPSWMQKLPRPSNPSACVLMNES